jgi:hypothetical protein
VDSLLIIGNGFDLAHGFRTRYEDFILNYLNHIDCMEQNQGIFEKILKNKAFAETVMGRMMRNVFKQLTA